MYVVDDKNLNFYDKVSQAIAGRGVECVPSSTFEKSDKSISCIGLDDEKLSNAPNNLIPARPAICEATLQYPCSHDESPPIRLPPKRKPYS